MELHAKLVRSQLNFFKPLAENCSLELTRKGQDKLGELMTAMHRRETFSREHDFRNFQGAWIMPKDERRTGVILYLHGGRLHLRQSGVRQGLCLYTGHGVRCPGVFAPPTGWPRSTPIPLRWRMRWRVMSIC